MLGGVLSLLLSNVYLLPAAMAQGELKTPDCSNPQDPMERMCCGARTPESCKVLGYKAPEDTPASSIPPLKEIALLAPLDVTIGMPLSDLLDKMKARGLRRRGACGWHTQSQDASATINVSLVSATGKDAPNCDKDFPVHKITFKQNERRKEVFSTLPLPADMAATWIERFGEPASDCRMSVPLPGSSRVICVFKNVGEDIKELTLSYVYRDPPNPNASLDASITGFDLNETAESAIGEEAGAASEDPQSAEAVLEREMSNPHRAKMACQVIRMAISSGNDASLAGTTVVRKGQLLTDMPEACKN